MTTKDLTMTEQLPDLPGLESVEAGIGRTLPLGVVMLAVLFLIVGGALWSLREYREFLGERCGFVYGVTAVAAVASIWVTVGILTGDYHWRTTPDGLFARSILRRRFVRWGEVRQATSRQSALRTVPSYTITASTGKFSIYPGTYSIIGLYASIWQHLRRVGRADGLILPVEALSIWDRIPDELPSEMDWTDARPPLLWPYIAIPAVFAAGVLWFSATEAMDGRYFIAVLMILFSSILPLMFTSMLREIRSSARQVTLHEDRLEAVTPRASIVLPWSEVTNGKWEYDSCSGGFRILIGGSGSVQAGIPYRPTSEESSKLILAIIRRLRTAGRPQALPVPDLLQVDPNAGALQEEPSLVGPVVLRLALPDRLGAAFFPGVPVVTLLALFLTAPNPNPWQIVIPALAAYVIGFVLGGSYHLCADANGVSVLAQAHPLG